MLSVFATDAELGGERSVPLYAVLPKDLERFRASLPDAQARWLRATGFAAKDGELSLLPAEGGALGAAVLGLGPGRDPHALALFSERLPPGLYTLADVPPEFGGARAAYAWGIGTYAFNRYREQRKSPRKEYPRLVMPPGVDGEAISRIAEGVFLARDLINTPANDMGPAELEQAARALAGKHGAKIQSTVGDDLLKQNFPLIHAVGRASPRAPRLIDFTWGNPAAPKITLVGKGVCFDTGGLDIKPDAGMLIMKKDMGGAANVLAAAHMIMDAKLPPGRGGQLVLPFSVWLMKRTLLGNPYIRPWEDLARLTDAFDMDEFMFGSYYVCRGIKP
jgi:leucyl aminopeptidase